MRSVELFAGCGGLALGLAVAGFKHSLVVENDPQCVTTLKENGQRGVEHVCEWPLSTIDAREICYEEFFGVDLVSGGPPCQPFSIGGKHLGPSDPRNLWPEAIRAVREIRPRGFILENVRGLFRPDFSAYLDYILLQLTYPEIEKRLRQTWYDHHTSLRKHAGRMKGKEGAYRVIAKTINAADYGAAQRRHRAIVVGIRASCGDSWSFPEPTHSQEALIWAKHIDMSYWRRHEVKKRPKSLSMSESRVLERVRKFKEPPLSRPWRTVRDAIGDLPPPSKRQLISGHWQHWGAKAYEKHTGSPMDEPAKALKAGTHGVPGGENMLAQTLGKVRYFTVREMARLQGFPDDYAVLGSWKAATRQLGNAVPVELAKVMGAWIKQTIASQKRK